MSTENLEKVVLITGGSRGIGAACALLAARQGYKVCVNFASNEQAALDVVKDIENIGASAIAVKGDVANEADILHMFAETKSRLGLVTGLINNAGILSKEGRLDTFSAERIARIIAVNVTGSILCAREAVKAMSTKHGGKGGSIVNISSVAATLGGPNVYVDYAATKGAIDTFTKGLALEVATEDIRVNGVRPGIINTDIHASGGRPDRVEELKHLIPMQRGGSALEVAEVVLWLMSDAASYVTGTTVDVSGGR
ncbi:MAG: SDR family oxidoreductase [Rhizobiaceae bacterium]|nr:SDR family oxidoreductase [Rhizobiaceae bacterium]